MASKIVPVLAATALALTATYASAAATPVTPAAETVPAGQSELEGGSGGLWFGALFTLATILVIVFHDEIFDDDEPVSA